MTTLEDRIAGCLFGTALGDALGAETEFMTVEAILRRWPPDGPQVPEGDPAHVTDDTQMAIAVARALLSVQPPYTPEPLVEALTREYIAWYHDPENTRAPGMTCLRSVEGLMTSPTWQDATDMHSKGCGANMRVQPVGLLPLDATPRAAIAQLQAAITHGNPTALAAADLTAWTIADLLAGGSTDTLLDRALNYAASQRTVYHGQWLWDLYTRTQMAIDGASFIATGWDEVIEILARVGDGLATDRAVTDPCQLTGAGWVAEEAYATALYCFLSSPGDPVATLRRGAVTSGDSDSITCIAGAFAGAHLGLGALPDEWVSRVEYHDALSEIASKLAAKWV